MYVCTCIAIYTHINVFSGPSGACSIHQGISGTSGFVVNISKYFGPFGIRAQYIKVFWFFKSCRSRRELSNALVKSF